eukprot:TRINITY_DN8469_c1_g1_i1.p3 TRINITY_DN8469_c1_g1~~TRINITY_DN8469_c1_g1_i1.p3  ORF type:complete len:306 (-),score=66.57 TRINITY_DN8469_c1_g1_i1:3727-4644(-)
MPRDGQSSSVPPQPKRSRSVSLGVSIQMLAQSARNMEARHQQRQDEMRRNHLAELAAREQAAPFQPSEQSATAASSKAPPPAKAVSIPAVPVAASALRPPTRDAPMPAATPADVSVPEDPYAQYDTFLEGIFVDARVLAVTKATFATVEEPTVTDTADKKLLEGFVMDICTKQLTAYKNTVQEFYKVASNLKKDVDLLKQGRVPRNFNIKDSMYQFKKEVSEVYDSQQKRANDEKAKKDADRRIEATKAWLDKTKPTIEFKKCTQETLHKVYEHIASTAVEYIHAGGPFADERQHHPLHDAEAAY